MSILPYLAPAVKSKSLVPWYGGTYSGTAQPPPTCKVGVYSY